eukprot:403338418
MKMVLDQKSDQNEVQNLQNQVKESKSQVQPQIQSSVKTTAIAKKRDSKQNDKISKKDTKTIQISKNSNTLAQQAKDTDVKSNDQEMADSNQIQNQNLDKNQQPQEEEKEKILPKTKRLTQTKIPKETKKKPVVKKAKNDKKNQVDNSEDEEEKQDVLVGKKRNQNKAQSIKSIKQEHKQITPIDESDEVMINTAQGELTSGVQKINKPKPKKLSKKLKDIPPEYFVQVTQPELFDPDTIEEDYKYSSTKHLLNTVCCVNCTNRNVFRAVITKNHDLLRKCIESTKQISTVLQQTWSPELKWTPLEWVFYNHDKQSLHMLMQQDVEQNKPLRVLPLPYKLQQFDNRSVEGMVHGIEVRKVQTARGNRAGNEAFLEEHRVVETTFRNYLQNPHFIQRLMTFPNLKYEHFEDIMAQDGNMQYFVRTQLVPKLLIHGKREIAEKLIKQLVDNYLANQFIHQCILPENLQVIPTTAVNHNSNNLAKLLRIIAYDIKLKFTTDEFQNSCIHYAAASETSSNMELLLARGMNLNLVNNENETPIFIAIRSNMPKNVEFIIQKVELSLQHKNSLGQNPIHLAAMLGFNDCIETICKYDIEQVDKVGGDKLTPLMYAVQQGQFETVKYLVLTLGADVNLKDKFKRNALTYAVRNGHLKIAAFLLQNMAYYNFPDNSKNLPLHFACAYGWVDCVRLLLKAGADQNINFQNEWGYTPLMIAMLKNHEQIVKELLNIEGININGVDDQGRSLLTFSLSTISEEALTYIKFLIEEKKANPHQEDVNGRTPLFYALEASLPILSEKLALDDTQTMNIDQRLQYEQQLHLKIMNYLIQSHNYQIDFENHPDFLIRFKPLQLINTELFDMLKGSNIKEEYLNGVNQEGNSILMHFLRNFIQDKSQIANITKYLILRRIINLANHFKEFGSYEGAEPRNTYFQQFVKNIKDIEGDINYMINYSPQQLLARDKLSISQQQQQGIQQLMNQSDGTNVTGISVAEKAARSIFKKMVTKKYLALLELLISKGADVNQFSFNVSYLANEIKIPEAKLLAEQITSIHQIMKRVKIIPISKLDNQKIAERVLDQADSLLKLQVNAVQSQSTQAEVRNKQQISTRRGLTTIIISLKCGLIFRILRDNDLDINQTTETNLSLIIMMTKELTNDPQRFINLYQELTKYKELDKNAVDENGNNAFLLAFQNNSMIIAQFLLDEGFNLDFQNKQLKTALIIAVQRRNAQYIKVLLDKGCNSNYTDNEGKTSLHYAVIGKDLNTVNMLLISGCNPNIADNEGKTALHYSVLGNDFDFVEILVENGSELDIADKKGRTALHYAVNNSQSGLDANYDIENILIASGANVNIQDKTGRTPLHYAFVKMGRGNMDRSAMDPIETVSSLCSVQDANPKIQDKYGKNVLHYAAQRGASISTMFLYKKGVDLHHQDLFGNTPLATALLCNHIQYAIMLINYGSEVKQLVHQESKEVYDEFKKKREQETMIDVQDDGYQSDDSYFKVNPQQINVPNQINTYNQNIFSNNQGLFGNQNQVGNQGIFANQNLFANQSLFGGHGGQQVQANINQAAQIQQPQTMFKLAVDSGQLGLSYLILDNGFDLFQAMESSLKKQKFQFILTLLSKVSENSVIQKLNPKGQNLFHIFAQNAFYLNPDNQKRLLTRIYKQFKRRGLDTQCQDIFGRTPLHYAAIFGAYSLVQELIQESGIDINVQDLKGFTPLILAIRGIRIAQGNNFQVFKLLIESGANCNMLYYDNMYKDEPVVIDQNQNDLMNIDMIDTSSQAAQNVIYKVTPYIHLIKQFDTLQNLRIQYLNLFFGKKCNQDLLGKDSNGTNALGILIKKNQMQNIKELFLNWEANKGKVKKEFSIKSQLDSDGRNPIHLLVTSNDFGMFDNEELFNFLVDKGFAFDLVDKHKKRPVDYASQYRYSRIYKRLIKLGQSITIQEEQKQNSQEDIEMICADQEFDIEKDAKEFLEKNKDEFLQKVEKKLLVPDEILGDQVKSLEVVYEDPNNLDSAYEAHLLKIDLRKQGQCVFYKIQLNFDPIKNIYILLTKWGSIGEQGACQKTPFDNLEEALAELKKIFKNKTSNNWEDRDKFVISNAKNKYILYKKKHFDVSYVDLLKPFKYSECHNSKLNEQAQTFMKLISNIRMYKDTLQLQIAQQSQINMTNIPIEKLEEAKRIFEKLEQIFSQQARIGLQDENQQKQIVMLTCQFYDIIPIVNGNEYPLPITQQELQQLKIKFEELSKLEKISKIFLGASNTLNSINPIDYIYKALNVNIDMIKKQSDEYQLVSTYLKNTGQNVFQNQVINNIFKINRKLDEESFNQNGFHNDPHKLLLIHGTSLESLMAILNQGFKVSQCGASGQGVQFSNSLEKSIQNSKQTNLRQHYLDQDEITDETNLTNRRYVIICEVAMGKIFKQEPCVVRQFFPNQQLNNNYYYYQHNNYNQTLLYGIGTQKQLQNILSDSSNNSTTCSNILVNQNTLAKQYEDDSSDNEEIKEMEVITANGETPATENKEVEQAYKNQIYKLPNGKMILGKKVDVTRTLRGHRMMQLQEQTKFKNYDTLWVNGNQVPDPEFNVLLKNGSIIPYGKPIPVIERNQQYRVNAHMINNNYNYQFSQYQHQLHQDQFQLVQFNGQVHSEFIVKNPNRIRIRYIVEIREKTQTEILNHINNQNLNLNDDEDI